MNCFQLIKKILDDNFSQIPGTDEERFRLIKDRILTLSSSYYKQDSKPDIDYSDPVTQFAYIFAYTTTHANFVYQLLSKAHRKDLVPTGEKIKLLSIGGGPGSDFLGFLKFLSFHEFSKIVLISNNLDKNQDWSLFWANVSETYTDCGAGEDTCSHIFPTFHQCNVTQKNALNKLSRLIECDLITMVFFMSEVFKHKDDAQPAFEYIFREAKPGTKMLFIDNRSDHYFGWFDSLSDQFNWKTRISGEEEWLSTFDEQKSTLHSYSKSLGRDPRIKGNIAYRYTVKLS